MKRVFKWTIPVDNKQHKIGGGPVIHVDFQDNAYEVAVWTEEGDRIRQVDAQIYGTGQPYPDAGLAVGSALSFQGNLVWHVVTFPASTTLDWEVIDAGRT